MNTGRCSAACRLFRAVERLLARVVLTWLVVVAWRLRRSGEQAAVRPR